MLSFAQRLAKYSLQTREISIQKPRGAAKPRGNLSWATPTRDCRSVWPPRSVFVDGYSLSFWIFNLVFRVYFAIRFAKLHILPQFLQTMAIFAHTEDAEF